MKPGQRLVELRIILSIMTLLGKEIFSLSFNMKSISLVAVFLDTTNEM